MVLLRTLLCVRVLYITSQALSKLSLHMKIDMVTLPRFCIFVIQTSYRSISVMVSFPRSSKSSSLLMKTFILNNRWLIEN